MRTAESVVFTLWPAGAGRAHDVDTEVVLVNLDLDLLGLRHDSHRRGRGVDPPLRLGLGNALHAVRSALELEDRERALALHGEHGLLDTASLALARRERLGLEAQALGVPREHPAHVPRPERRLIAAHTLPDLDDHILLVGGVALDERELEFAFEPVDLGFELRHLVCEARVAPRDLEILLRLTPLVRQPLRRLELLQTAPAVGSLTVVVVDRRVGHALLRFRVGAVQLVDEALDRHRLRVSGGWMVDAMRSPTPGRELAAPGRAGTAVAMPGASVPLSWREAHARTEAVKRAQSGR